MKNKLSKLLILSILLAPALVSAARIENPIEADKIQTFVSDLLDIIIQIGVIFVVLVIVYVGFQFVTARGDTGKLSKAREAFTWTVIGAIILLGAQVIAKVLENTANELQSSLPIIAPFVGSIFSGKSKKK